MFSLRKRDTARPRLLERQVPDGRVAPFDYTQLCEQAASEGLLTAASVEATSTC
jgi:hypothetical protein